MSDFTETPKTAAGEDAEAQLRRLQGEQVPSGFIEKARVP